MLTKTPIFSNFKFFCDFKIYIFIQAKEDDRAMSDIYVGPESI